jgi:hypothetical protein
LAAQRAAKASRSASDVPAGAKQSSSLKNAVHCLAIWQSRNWSSGASS